MINFMCILRVIIASPGLMGAFLSVRGKTSKLRVRAAVIRVVRLVLCCHALARVLINIKIYVSEERLMRLRKNGRTSFEMR